MFFNIQFWRNIPSDQSSKKIPQETRKKKMRKMKSEQAKNEKPSENNISKNINQRNKQKTEI